MPLMVTGENKETSSIPNTGAPLQAFAHAVDTAAPHPTLSRATPHASSPHFLTDTPHSCTSFTMVYPMTI